MPRAYGTRDPPWVGKRPRRAATAFRAFRPTRGHRLALVRTRARAHAGQKLSVRLPWRPDLGPRLVCRHQLRHDAEQLRHVAQRLLSLPVCPAYPQTKKTRLGTK